MNLNTSNPAIKRILSEVKKMVQLLQADLPHNLLAAYPPALCHRHEPSPFRSDAQLWATPRPFADGGPFAGV
jgi:hypothetical protein